MEATNKLKEIKEEEEAQNEIWKYVFGYVNMAIVKCAIELGIADAIQTHKTPISLKDLSTLLQCSPPYLYRIMRFLVHQNIFKQEPITQHTIGYSQTPLSRFLQKNYAKTLAPLILLESSPIMLAPWHNLSNLVTLGDSSYEYEPFKAAHGQEIWTYSATNLNHSELINDAMSCGAKLTVSAIVEDCPDVFEGLESLVDVGGGHGTALSILVKSFPFIKGINFDVPHVISVAKKCDGVQHVEGDMFDHVPKADAVFIMWVLHDWSDDECIKILKNCREAIPKNKGKVIIVDIVIEEEKDEKLKHVRLMLDMVMMAHTSKGKERTFKEWEYVLKEAGFNRINVKPIKAIQSVIEAYP